MSTILVTGARGTVGTYIVSLAEAAGHRVIASDLHGKGLREPVRGEIRKADLRDRTVFDDLVRGCDVVIHAAAQRQLTSVPSEFSLVNTEAVRGLYESATRAGVKRFIHISTATNYALPTTGLVRENTVIAPRGPLGLSRHGAEVYLLGKTEGPAWTILRPAPIYGPRGRHFASLLLAFGPIMQTFLPFVRRPIGGPLGVMVHAEDVARAALFVMKHDQSERAVFNVTDGDVMTLGDRLAITLDCYQILCSGKVRLKPKTTKGILFPFSQEGLRFFADGAAQKLWTLVVKRYGLKPALKLHFDHEMLPLLYEDMVIDDGALRALGFTPRHTNFKIGFKEALKWYQAERWVPRYEGS